MLSVYFCTSVSKKVGMLWLRFHWIKTYHNHCLDRELPSSGCLQKNCNKKQSVMISKTLKTQLLLKIVQRQDSKCWNTKCLCSKKKKKRASRVCCSIASILRRLLTTQTLNIWELRRPTVVILNVKHVSLVLVLKWLYFVLNHHICRNRCLFCEEHSSFLVDHFQLLISPRGQSIQAVRAKTMVRLLGDIKMWSCRPHMNTAQQWRCCYFMVDGIKGCSWLFSSWTCSGKHYEGRGWHLKWRGWSYSGWIVRAWCGTCLSQSSVLVWSVIQFPVFWYSGSEARNTWRLQNRLQEGSV